MARVRLADDFFKKERDQAYADWQLAIWRELFQNSIDQRATEIDIHLTQHDGYVSLDFRDNGPGMPRDVLENVYFAIGATTKGGDQIGGMGRARVLTCFAMKSYRIRSHDYLVLGQGGEYEVQDAAWMSGCWLTIAIDDATLEQLQDKLLTFLGESRIDARIRLNGALLTVRASLNGRLIRDLALADGTVFGQVYLNKSNDSKRMIVRVNGVSMYTTQIDVKSQIVVELVPAMARSALTANRDGMHYDYRRVVDRFVRELTVNTTSALRPRFARRTTVMVGYGLQTVSKPVKKITSSVIELMNSVSESTSEAPPFMPDRDNDLDTYSERLVLRTNSFATWLGRTFGDIHIYDETERPEVHKVVGQYLPENWRLWTANGRTFRKGGNILKVLLMWHTAITYALEVSLETLRKTDVQYGVGFVFSDDRAAEHRKTSDGHVFVLNPVDQMGKLRYAVVNRKSLKRIMAYAKHEVTHVEESWHGEDFSRLREMIDIAFDEAECLRRMKSALRKVPDLVRGFDLPIAA